MKISEWIKYLKLKMKTKNAASCGVSVDFYNVYICKDVYVTCKFGHDKFHPECMRYIK